MRVNFPLFFDGPPQGSTFLGHSSAQLPTGSYMRRVWATLAKDPTKGLTNRGGREPIYSPFEDALIRLAFQNITGTNIAQGNLYDLGAITFGIPMNSTVCGNASTTSTSSSPAFPPVQKQ